MDYEDLLELLKNRRSIRRFKSDPIPDGYIDKIIEAATWAPSGFNSQPWEFVVVRDPELKDKMIKTIETLRPPLPGQTREGPTGYWHAPVFIILFGDPRAMAALPVPPKLPIARSIQVSGLASAFLYMQLAATALGLASNWVTAVQADPIAGQIKELLGIPAIMEPYDMMAVGYPAMKPRSKLMRDKEKMVHYDKCNENDFRTNEEVEDFVGRTKNWMRGTVMRSLKSE